MRKVVIRKRKRVWCFSYQDYLHCPLVNVIRAYELCKEFNGYIGRTTDN